MIYADYAATTPLDGDVFNKMLPYWKQCFGNASSTHSFGREAARNAEEARRIIAQCLNCDKNEIYFTSGGTESDNWSIFGIARKHKKGHIIVSEIEHHAILNACKYLEKQGYEVSYAPVNNEGILQTDSLEKLIKDNTCLISVMAANNEIGTIQPIKEIGNIAKKHGILFHCDCVQAVGSIDIDVKEQNISMLSLSAHKIFGPKGIGALYIKKGTLIENLMFGGSQEHDRRPGTSNTPLIVGMGAALEKYIATKDERIKRISAARDIIDNYVSKLPGVILNGSRTHRLDSNLSYSFEGVNCEGLLLLLDFEGIACSTGAACSAGAVGVSHVVSKLRNNDLSALRVTLSHLTSEQEAEIIGKSIVKNVNKLRNEK